jgi:hypothetical protein
MSTGIPLAANIAYRVLLATVDLGWTPPAWRTNRNERPFGKGESIARVIETQVAIRG